jgi:hypothetical protein
MRCSADQMSLNIEGVVDGGVERNKGNRCGDSTPSRFANPIGAYAFLLNLIGCQYSRMAAIAGAMSRHS